jgi:hypothetical protein
MNKSDPNDARGLAELIRVRPLESVVMLQGPRR